MVSVIVCAYNGARFLGQALESALAQTHSDFELVLVDDGSTDSSLAIAEAFRDPRIRVIRQSNQGAAAALATGLRESSRRYAAFLDQDDFWEPEKLAVHLELMERKPELALTFSWFRYVDAGSRHLGIESIRYRGTISFRGLMEDFVIGATSNVVARRAAIEKAGGIDSAFPRLHDLELFLRIAALAPDNIEAIPRDLMSYRRHDTQISRDFTEMETEWERLMSKMGRLWPEVTRSALGPARVNIRRYFARLAYEQRDYGRALGYSGKGLAADPMAFLTDARNWLTAGACLCGAVLPEPLLRRLERIAGLERE